MTSNWPLITLLLLAAMVFGALLRGRGSLAGTTMMAPWWWCAASVVAIVLAECLIAFASTDQMPAWTSTARYVAAVGTFCPIMAVLGAKRPQDRGWQWVVLTLWIVLCVPVAHALVTRTEGNFQLHFAWKMLLVGLIAMQTINYLGARTFGAAILVAMAQLAMLGPQLIGRYESSPFICLIGMGLLLLATAVAHVGRGKNTEPSSDTLLLWQRFRYLYGTFWSFRVMGLINQTAGAAKWPVILLPAGFYHCSKQHESILTTNLPPELEKEIHQALRNTLRRFLSERDIAHLPNDGTS